MVVFVGQYCVGQNTSAVIIINTSLFNKWPYKAQFFMTKGTEDTDPHHHQKSHPYIWHEPGALGRRRRPRRLSGAAD